MNILVPDSWLREYLETDATPKQIKDCLSLCGPSVEGMEKTEDDFIYNIEITSNRPDMASVLGIAGEANAILPRFDIPAKLKSDRIQQTYDLNIKLEKELPLKVKIEKSELCPRFAAIILDNVTIRPSPEFAQGRLIKSGIRAINNVVDISNYLMLLFGQPVHTFDYDKIMKATMIMRESKKGESLTTLDGKTFTLEGGDIVIEDGQGRLIDLCGIMGGENSAVDNNTKRVLLFVQTYDPIRIRKTSMKHGQRTEAATLFEKNLDPENVLPTILYGIHLFKEWAGAKEVSRIIDIYHNQYKSRKITVSSQFINQRLGIKLTIDQITDILQSLSFNTVNDNDKLIINVPSFRQFDITIPEDIVEEVARIYGYHNLPPQLMTGKIPVTDKPKDLPLEDKIKQMLKYWGYTEIYNYSFISEELIEKAGTDKKFPLKVANPLTEQTAYMRVSLIPSMLETIAKNQHFSFPLNLFELSKVYIPQKGNLPQETSMLTIANQSGFYELKGIVEAILKELGITDYQSLEKSSGLYWHPKQTLHFVKNDLTLASLGKAHPDLTAKFAIKKDLYLAEINVTRLVSFANPLKKYTAIPLYPAVIEDLTLLLQPHTKLGPVITEITKSDPLVAKVELSDRYKNTVTFRLTYRNSQKNLTNEEVKIVRDKILRHLQEKFNITLKQ